MPLYVFWGRGGRVNCWWWWWWLNWLIKPFWTLLIVMIILMDGVQVLARRSSFHVWYAIAHSLVLKHWVSWCSSMSVASKPKRRTGIAIFSSFLQSLFLTNESENWCAETERFDWEKKLIYYSVRSAHKSGRLSKLSKRVFLLPELKIDVNFGNAKWALFRGSSLLVSTWQWGLQKGSNVLQWGNITVHIRFVTTVLLVLDG